MPLSSCPGTGKDMFIGQSWASGPIFKDWRSAVEDGWYSEVKFFSYGSSYHRGVVGHYTQVDHCLLFMFVETTYQGRIQGGGVLGVRNPPFWGTPKLQKEGKTSRVRGNAERFST